MCGCLASSETLILSNRMFRNLVGIKSLRQTLGEYRVLIDRFQSASDGKVILELNRYLLISQSLENGEDELQDVISATPTR